MLQKLLDKLGLNDMIKNLMPAEMGQVMSLITDFAGFAGGAKDQGAAKEGEASQASGIFEAAKAMGAQSIGQTQANEAQADGIG